MLKRFCRRKRNSKPSQRLLLQLVSQWNPILHLSNECQLFYPQYFFVYLPTCLCFHISQLQAPVSTESQYWIYGENVSSCTTNTWEIFDHRSLLQNIFLISAKLNFHVTYSTTHQRSEEVQFGRYQKKNILQEWSMFKNLSCVSCAAWNVFPINSISTGTTIQRNG